MIMMIWTTHHGASSLLNKENIFLDARKSSIFPIFSCLDRQCTVVSFALLSYYACLKLLSWQVVYLSGVCISSFRQCLWAGSLCPCVCVCVCFEYLGAVKGTTGKDIKNVATVFIVSFTIMPLLIRIPFGN